MGDIPKPSLADVLRGAQFAPMVPSPTREQRRNVLAHAFIMSRLTQPDSLPFTTRAREDVVYAAYTLATSCVVADEAPFGDKADEH